ncbi:hypothetical protein HUE46_01355 [Flavobacterium columnare]|nr:hypothetical protein HUE41_01355 [Flavobacterium columnare]QOG93734.1 hypothetical protein HUE42_01350 [Flavobacterium columnare]QOG96401.1 hypothetical protein HUE43_01355 [Flavobacterium columnare]QOG99060.1 hypothetical protein HUE44_01350 [Flavobacterium columnare]QOH01719.1 hypothetical protein HUE45_01350 [Flavobacterium columnare]
MHILSKNFVKIRYYGFLSSMGICTHK